MLGWFIYVVETTCSSRLLVDSSSAVELLRCIFAALSKIRCRPLSFIERHGGSAQLFLSTSHTEATGNKQSNWGLCLCRTVNAEDKSFAVGVQYMLFRVLGESSKEHFTSGGCIFLLTTLLISQRLWRIVWSVVDLRSVQSLNASYTHRPCYHYWKRVLNPVSAQHSCPAPCYTAASSTPPASCGGKSAASGLPVSTTTWINSDRGEKLWVGFKCTCLRSTKPTPCGLRSATSRPKTYFTAHQWSREQLESTCLLPAAVVGHASISTLASAHSTGLVDTMWIYLI